MQDHSKRLSEPLRWTRSGRVALGLVVTALCLAAAVAVVLAPIGGSSARRGCIEVTFPSTLGAAVLRECGIAARRTCANPAQRRDLAAHGALREACRHAGLRYGHSRPATA